MTNPADRQLKVFLCHSSGDKPTVRDLYRQLIAEDWMDVWLDEMKLLPGQEWDVEIEKAVEEADIVLVCLSTRSVDKEGYVQKELRFVLNIADEKPEGALFVIPLRLDDCVVPRRLKHWQWVDYFPDNQKSFAYQRLLESLKVRARKLGISFDKSKVELAPTPTPAPAPVAIPQKQQVEEKPTEENSEIERLKSLAIQYELRGDFWNALQTYYQIKKLDPLFPRVDVKIRQLEKEIQHKPVPVPELQTSSVRTATRNSSGLFRPLTIGIAAVLVIILCVWGGVSIWNNLASPTLGIGSTMISDKDGMTLLYVPAGEFTMGNENDSDDEKPVHKVNLDAFWIDQSEVTNAMYAACVEAGVCDEPTNESSYTHSSYYGNAEFDNYPVIYVDWNMAKTYCEWVDRRLPTEAEWEKAARWNPPLPQGGGEGEAFKYPWGNTFDGSLVNFCDTNCSFDWADKSSDDGFADVAPVGNYPNGASPYGAYDMAGNVWEWVSSLYQPYPYDGTDGREDLTSSDSRALRGGSWNYVNYEVRSARRSWGGPSNSDLNLGFRCAMSATP